MHILHMSKWIFIHNSSVPITLERTTDKVCQKDLIAPLLNSKCALSSALACSRSEGFKVQIARSYCKNNCCKICNVAAAHICHFCSTLKT